jgi:anti-sigma regulatory factor (Ser/Thr protein kinase)
VSPVGDPSFVTRPFEVSYHLPADLATVRALVRERAIGLGLSAVRADLLTVAVSELATNTLQHTDGGGRIELWADGDEVFCDVIDGGPARRFGRAMPAGDSPRGRGLAIVERICDQVGVTAGEDGTRVRLMMTR